jgi:hypothetical protein
MDENYTQLTFDEEALALASLWFASHEDAYQRPQPYKMECTKGKRKGDPWRYELWVTFGEQNRRFTLLVKEPTQMCYEAAPVLEKAWQEYQAANQPFKGLRGF